MASIVADKAGAVSSVELLLKKFKIQYVEQTMKTLRRFNHHDEMVETLETVLVALCRNPNVDLAKLLEVKENLSPTSYLETASTYVSMANGSGRSRPLFFVNVDAIVHEKLTSHQQWHRIAWTRG